jgi:hypothetical protein
MKATAIRFTLAGALLSSTAAFADQPFGRDSVYATAGTVATAAPKGPALARSGRSSVFAYDVPAPTPKDQVRIAVAIKPGRA